MRIKYGGQVVIAGGAREQEFGEAYSYGLRLSQQAERVVNGPYDVRVQVWAGVSCDECGWSVVIDPCLSIEEAEGVVCRACGGAEVVR